MRVVAELSVRGDTWWGAGQTMSKRGNKARGDLNDHSTSAAAPRALYRLRNCRGGFTLIEVLAASVVLAMSVLAVTQAILAGQSQTYDSLKQSRALELAECVLEEAIALGYPDTDVDATIGPEDGELSPADFDNAADYHGYSQSAGELSDPSGALLPTSYQGFDYAIEVTQTTVDVAMLGGQRSGLTVQVIVTEPGGRTWTIDRFMPEPVEVE